MTGCRSINAAARAVRCGSRTVINNAIMRKNRATTVENIIWVSVDARLDSPPLPSWGLATG
jgi:hypothetical protein